MSGAGKRLQDSLIAIVLAGQRSAEDPLAQHTGTSCKALVEIDGEALLSRVLGALKEARLVTSVLLSGPGQSQLADNKAACSDAAFISWSESRETPSTSAYQLLQTLPPDQPVLVTSSDQPFLNAQLIDRFCEQSLAHEADVTIGLVPYPLVKAAFPDMPKTILHFSDGDYCGSNLFAFLTQDGRRAADYWRAIEDARKRPLKIIRILGWLALLRYRMGWLSLPAALKLLSRRFNMRIHAIELPYADAAIDVDTIVDYELVQREFKRRSVSAQ